MYAIVEIAGFQEMVKEGDVLKIPLQKAETDKTVTFERVLLIGNGDNVTVGTPLISGASVEVTVTAAGKSDKIRVVKTNRRKRYHRVHGHRQDYTVVKVTKIKA
jgi:large subunit ribosomal protein L21